MEKIEKTKRKIGVIKDTEGNIKKKKVTTEKIKKAAPVLTIMHFWGADPPFIPATLIPAIVVPVGLEKVRESVGRGGYGRGNLSTQPNPTPSKPSRLRRCAQEKSLNLGQKKAPQ